MTESTNLLLKTLIEGQTSLDEKVGKMADSITVMALAEATRVEREVVQKEVNTKLFDSSDRINKKLDDFIELNKEPLTRLKRFQSNIDKAIGGVISKIVLAASILAAGSFLGIKWIG